MCRPRSRLSTVWRKSLRFTKAYRLGCDFGDFLVGQSLSFAFPLQVAVLAPNVRNELITASRDCYDVSVLTRPLTETPPECRHVNCEVVLLHHRVRPDPTHQFVLVDDSLLFFEQHQKNLKSFRGKSYLITFA